MPLMVAVPLDVRVWVAVLVRVNVFVLCAASADAASSKNPIAGPNVTERNKSPMRQLPTVRPQLHLPV